MPTACIKYMAEGIPHPIVTHKVSRRKTSPESIFEAKRILWAPLLVEPVQASPAIVQPTIHRRWLLGGWILILWTAHVPEISA